jgi:CHAT domain-containing protein
VSDTRADLQRRLAAEFDRRGWEYDLLVGPALVDEVLRQSAVDPVALARIVSSDFRRGVRASADDVADAISRAFSGIVLDRSPGVGGMRLLFVAADPEDAARLRLDAEHRDIRSRIRSSSSRDQVIVEFAGAARPTDLIDELNRTQPTILHLAGHGGVSGIALEDEHGMAVDVTTDQLKRLVATADDSLRLVVMNTCESAYQAQPMVQSVDAAIGMTRTIGDDAARTFAAQLYSSLAEGVPLYRAFEQARLQISLAGLPEDTTPALFVRTGVDPSSLVFTT